ncbi:DNA alkylation repair protein [bacterium]|nr:DNA alkylation repair protein [bacterium]
MGSYAEEVRAFCRANADADIAAKYARFFVEGYDPWGVDSKLLEKQRQQWLDDWDDALGLDGWLELADELTAGEKYEEISFGISFVAARRERFDGTVLPHVTGWLERGRVRNWAHADVLACDLIQALLLDGHNSLADLELWKTAADKYQRRVAATSAMALLEGVMINAGGRPVGDKIPARAVPIRELLAYVQPLVNDDIKQVQQGVGWFLKKAWEAFPDDTEAWLLEHKAEIKPLVMRTAIEKVPKDRKAAFRIPRKKSR